MDPKATLELVARAIRDDDFELASELLLAYHDWRSHEGFEPVMFFGMKGDNYASELERLTATRQLAFTDVFQVSYTPACDACGVTLDSANYFACKSCRTRLYGQPESSRAMIANDQRDADLFARMMRARNQLLALVDSGDMPYRTAVETMLCLYAYQG